jgi:hypothetical protein
VSFRALDWAFTEAPVTNKADLLVLLVLANHANDTGLAWPSVPRISKHSRLSERAVYYGLRRLVAAGVIQVASQKPGRSTRYRVQVTPANGAGVQGVQGADGAGTPANHDRQPLQAVHPNRKKEPPSNRKTARASDSRSRQILDHRNSWQRGYPPERPPAIERTNAWQDFYPDEAGKS